MPCHHEPGSLHAHEVCPHCKPELTRYRFWADGVLIETMIALEEALAAVEAVHEVAPDLPCFVTMTFTESGRTPFGVSPEDAVRAL